MTDLEVFLACGPTQPAILQYVPYIQYSCATVIELLGHHQG